MPNFDYKCTGCGTIQVMEFRAGKAPDEIKVVCGTSGKEEVWKRVFTAPGLVFKGTGFYSTDARSRAKDD